MSSIGLAFVTVAGSAMALPVGAPQALNVNLTPTPASGPGACQQSIQGPLFSAISGVTSTSTAPAQIVNQ
ncbi:MAG: hypothetical protein ACMG6S_14330, partial [Byssovorax sp.]